MSYEDHLNINLKLETQIIKAHLFDCGRKPLFGEFIDFEPELLNGIFFPKWGDAFDVPLNWSRFQEFLGIERVGPKLYETTVGIRFAFVKESQNLVKVL